MDRTLPILATVFLLAALMLSLFVSLSLPYLPALDITRVHLASGSGVAGIDTLSELRLGIWGICAYANDGVHSCIQKKLGYAVTIFNSRADPNNSNIIKSSWTRGLVVHIIATGFIFLAFLASFSEKSAVKFVTLVLSCLATLVTFIAFTIDIALFALVRSLVEDISIGTSARTAPGFWLTSVSLVLVVLASTTFCYDHRRGLQLPHANI
ncbi:actin cortical patch SUR7/pH-response regulator pali [Pholiota molesta]|nr:actin cortical patch SUR7/pH-response regulator pali [Pholiota molesta]